jgi:hypothetical protein
MKTYDKQWGLWSSYLDRRFHGVISPLLSGVQYGTKVLIILNYMSCLYEAGLRGDRIWRIVGAIKQSMFIRMGCVVCFNDPRILQARKSCRYSTQEIKDKVTSSGILQSFP